MNFFEQELRKLFGDGKIVQDPKFVGRVCLGTLDGDLQVRVEFVTGRMSDQYDNLQLVVLNRTDGEVDRLVLRFHDTFGRKRVSNLGFQDGVIPHIWESGKDVDWYVYRPTFADYQVLRQAAGDYLDVFRERTQEREHSAPARKNPGRSTKKKGRDER